MRRPNPLPTLVALCCLVLAACTADKQSAEDQECFGMAPAEGLPERVGGFEFGKVHDLGNGNLLDLTGFTGCQLPDGKGVVTLFDGRFASVYHLDCEHLSAEDIPAEVRPTQTWLCYGPGVLFR